MNEITLTTPAQRQVVKDAKPGDIAWLVQAGEMDAQCAGQWAWQVQIVEAP